MNKAVFTVKDVIEKKKPILYVVHDKEGEWQFLTGNDININDLMIISLEQILAIDPTLGDLSWLPPGMEGTRKHKEDNWEVVIFKE